MKKPNYLIIALINLCILSSAFVFAESIEEAKDSSTVAVSSEEKKITEESKTGELEAEPECD